MYKIARYRAIDRKRVRPTRKETEQLQNVIKPEQGYNIFQNTCWSYLYTAVEDKVRGIMLPSVKKAPNSGKKCKGKKAKKEADMDKARRDFRTKLMGARKLPDGLRKQTIDDSKLLPKQQPHGLQCAEGAQPNKDRTTAPIPQDG
ncbi:hypothetical protein BGZ89_009665 [Linnemannia elongata]|nr:hypothetical protein BGZ89_009665 [Linnemannia elongata]